MIDNFSFPVVSSGKVRTLYALDEQSLLCVTSDRISAFDRVLRPEVPHKGRILTEITQKFASLLDNESEIVLPHHLLNGVRSTSLPLPESVRSRSLIIKRLTMIPIECIARGYLTGSALKEYQKSGTVSGQKIEKGLVEGMEFDTPIFSPSTKATVGGSDMNITFAQLIDTVGLSLAERLRDLTLSLYSFGKKMYLRQGIILADTKFEFGYDSNGDLTLADEFFTPDSSRLWVQQYWKPGRSQQSIDKQFVRNWLLNLSGWSLSSGLVPPQLPADIVEKTSEKYVDVLNRVLSL